LQMNLTRTKMIGNNINILKSNKSVPAEYFLENLNIDEWQANQAWVNYDSIKNLLEVRLPPFSERSVSPIFSMYL